MNALKLALSLSPAIAALLTAFGLVITEADIAGWINAVIVLVGVLGTVVPSVKAWSRYGEKAD